MRITPSDIVLSKVDKTKILVDIVHEEVLPLQVLACWAALALSTHVILLNNSDWYHNMNSWVIVARIGICIASGFAEGVALVLLLGPLVEKIDKHWHSYESAYREEAVKKVEELLLAEKKADDY